MRGYSWSWMNITMESLLQMVALLAVVAATSASDYGCTYSGNRMDCSDRGLNQPPPGYWPDITTLVLNHNAITNFPVHSLSGFPNLYSLSIRNNSLTELDFGVLATLPNLNSLDVYHNQIETIIPPAAGIICSNLRIIYSGVNRISKIDPDSFLFAPYLHSLFLLFNPLVVEAGQPIFNHPELQVLSVGFGTGSHLELDPSLLSALPNLRQVELFEAQGSSINGAFASNDLLEFVDLRYSGITQITSDTFSSAGVITRLILSENPLKRLDTAAVNHAMAKGGAITVTNTPLACECLYEALYWWASSKGVTLDATCTSNGQSKCPFTEHLESPEQRL